MISVNITERVQHLFQFWPYRVQIHTQWGEWGLCANLMALNMTRLYLAPRCITWHHTHAKLSRWRTVHRKRKHKGSVLLFAETQDGNIWPWTKTALFNPDLNQWPLCCSTSNTSSCWMDKSKLDPKQMTQVVFVESSADNITENTRGGIKQAAWDKSVERGYVTDMRTQWYNWWEDTLWQRAVKI